MITLTNTGTYTATFDLGEVNAPAQELVPTGPFAIPTRHTSPKHLADLDAAAVTRSPWPVNAPSPISVQRAQLAGSGLGETGAFEPVDGVEAGGGAFNANPILFGMEIAKLNLQPCSVPRWVLHVNGVLHPPLDERLKSIEEVLAGRRARPGR